MSNFPLTEQEIKPEKKRGPKYNPLALHRFGNIYRLWGYIKERCYRNTSRNFHNYGGRGIVMCDEWKNDSKAFVFWCLENGYRKGLDIDRKDNDGPYSPDNCRFVTRKVNCNNTRANVKVMFRGVAFTLSELSMREDCVVSQKLLASRLRNGWDVELAMTRPVPDKVMLAKIRELESDPNCTVSHNTILYRVKELGWTLERAALTPSTKPWLKR